MGRVVERMHFERRRDWFVQTTLRVAILRCASMSEEIEE